jgi:hypothetical protein
MDLECLAGLSQLILDLRNAVVNTHYEFFCLDLELNRGPHYHPARVRYPEDDHATGLEKFYRELAYLQASVRNLPAIISGIRAMKKDGEMEGYKLAVQVALDLFKYRIPNVPDKSSIR